MTQAWRMAFFQTSCSVVLMAVHTDTVKVKLERPFHYRCREMLSTAQDQVIGVGEPTQWPGQSHADLPETGGAHVRRGRYTSQSYPDR